jgi:transcriptional regulator with XRE-family HTH domain
MDECCLVFDLSIRSGVKERYHNECFLNRDETSTISFDVVYGKGYQHATPEKQSELLASVLTEKARIYAELPNCYIASLQKVREWRDITYDELAERILIDARTIRRIMNGETNGSILSLVWICLGLHLPPEISNHIIDKSHHSLNYTNDSHVYYRFAINHLYAKKVEEIRAFLLRQGAET